MLHALLHRKLSSRQSNSEDLLTSTVFGVLSYMPPTDGLFPFLRNAAGDACGALRQQLEQADPATVSYEFWPSWVDANGRNCEPDLLISWHAASGAGVKVLIEAKYRSGKSGRDAEPSGNGALKSSGSEDQLARQWMILQHLAAKDGALPFLIYVTADFALPAHDLSESRAALESRGCPDASLLWVSWRAVAPVLDGASAIARDLKAALSDEYRLTYFRSLSTPGISRPWHFRRSVRNSWSWPSVAPKPSFRFAKG